MIDASILVIDDDDDILLSAKLFLKQRFRKISICKSPKDLNVLLSTNEVDIILLDMNYQKGSSDGREGLYWLEHILSINKHYLVVMMTAFGNVDLAVQAIKLGAIDFILKPWENEKLFAMLCSASNLKQSRKQLEQIPNSRRKDVGGQLQNIIGTSAPIQKLQGALLKIAPTDANILILGENGTGKQVFAHEIHRHSQRKDRIFVHVDLGSLNENLFESELFGYAKGAFTDAKEEKSGRFEMAEGGTIFLDEIGNLSLPLQAKLLSVIQNRTINRLGDGAERKIDVRLITATNMPLSDMVTQGTFRQDLLFRINTVELLLPPLRERGDDILDLANFFLKSFNNQYQRSIQKFSTHVEGLLLNYDWPGNVRELQHVVERAVIMADGISIEPVDIQLHSKKLGSTPGIPANMALEDVEKIMIENAIGKHQGNISRAASELGLTRAALYRRIEKFNL